MANNNFPVTVKKQPVDLDFALRNESNYLLVAQNNMGNLPIISNGGTTNLNWKSQTKPTVTANAWYSAKASFLTTNAGRKLVITAMHFETTDACQIGLSHFYDTGSTLSGTTGSISVAGGANSIFASQNIATGGVVTIDFTSKPLIISGSQRIDLFLQSNTTTGTNWNFWAEGYDITDDENYNAPKTICVIGDSIASLCGENRALAYSKREDGTKTGIWGNIIQNNLLEAGINSRLVSLGIGGTNTSQWDWFTNIGRLKYASLYDMLIINLGMNDCSSDTGLSTITGIDGNYKKALKNIIRSYFRVNPNGTCILNNITASDLASRTTLVSTGIYAGQQRIVAYRLESALVVSELKVANQSWDLFLANTDTSYTSSQTTYFVETVGGTLTHPNIALGQPAIAEKVWEKVLLSKLYLEN